jgi:tRNA nucleotidyltransferase (CCA-adding enzyme)
MNTTTKHKLSLDEQKLFNGLSNYLDVDFYYYGSIQRDDYIPGKSDIDVAIFTPNEKSILIKMQHYLNVDKDEFKRVLWKIKKNNIVTYGYKLKYEKDNMQIEFAIYNEKSKEDIKEFLDTDINIPFYIGLLLYILKFLYYQLNIISLPSYSYFKRKLFSYNKTIASDGKEEQFIVLKNKYNRNNI